jgi:hypothetical protein
MALVGVLGGLVYATGGAKYRLIDNNPVSFDYGLTEDQEIQQCFLLENQNAPFSDNCAGKGSDAPLVVVWGDSHANSVALGVANLESMSTRFRLGVYTASGCPPILAFEVENRPFCRNINEFVKEQIRLSRPKTVILSAFWGLYNGHVGWNLLDLDKLKATAAELKKFGIEDVVLVGSLPTFDTIQPRIDVTHFVADKIDRTFFGFNRVSASVNVRMSEFASTNGIQFVSPIDLLCNSEGCLMSTSVSKLVPVAWDYGHLTKDGAKYLISEAIRKKELVLP